MSDEWKQSMFEWMNKVTMNHEFELQNMREQLSVADRMRKSEKETQRKVLKSFYEKQIHKQRQIVCMNM